MHVEQRERSQLEWRIGDPGDPAALVENFLTAHGLPCTDLATLGRGRHPTSRARDGGAGGGGSGSPVPDGVAVVSVRNRTSGRPAPGEKPIKSGTSGHTARDGVSGHGGPAPGERAAVIHLSAAACALLAGLPAGPGTPAPAVPDVVVSIVDGPWLPAAAGPPGEWRLARWTPSWTTQQHAAAVQRVREAIAAGEVYQVNLVGHASARYRGDPLPALARVAALSGARYPTVLAGNGWALGCASPETLVRVGGGRIETLPIKGTRPPT